MPACAAAAARATRPPTSGAPQQRVDADTRYVVANGFEADPGAQVDRTLMENDPHAMVEGIAVAAYAIGATRAYIAVRAGRPTVAAPAGRRPCAWPKRPATSAATRSAPASTCTSRSSAYRAAWSWARRPRCCAHSRTSAPSPTSARPTRRAADCGAGRQSSTTSRRSACVPWIVANGSAAFAAIGDKTLPGYDAGPVRGRGRLAGHRRGAAGHVAAPAARHCRRAGRRSRPCSSAAPPAASCRRPNCDTLYTPEALVGPRAPSGARATLVRRRAGHVPGRDGHDAGALPVRRGVRQDDPVPHRPAPSVRDRPPGNDRPGPARRPAGAAGACGATFARRPVRPRVLRAQSVPDRDAILRRRVRRSTSRTAAAPPACADRCASQASQ